MRPPTPVPPVSSLWLTLSRLPTLPKIRMFGWWLAHEALPTGRCVFLVGLSDGFCPLCGTIEETVLHVLRDCDDVQFNLNPAGFTPHVTHGRQNCQKRSKRSQIRVGAMAADEGKVKIEKFDGADFGFWKMQIEDFLYQKNLYQPLSGKQPEGMKDEDWALLDRQALGVIRLTLSRNVAFNIAKEKTTAGLMAALSSMYEKPSASNKVHLMRRLFNLRMAEGASVAQHLNELNTITTQYASEGIKAACDWAYKGVEQESVLEDDYFLSRIPIVHRRLAQGGVRLAATLNRIFG
ncbi:hypothetical protein F3Y22_tig00110597pilonHSYRG00962 [Hibiscus syriacus]|uniref:Aspergillus nuclease S1 n=1 Tax=Hibiscus syriacus TaxID=106335 RepID=A0A6A3A6M1_HIBSY|nr:hypothetical protein F3Y22_tig00110597pilonHSYRG00962 [Hibiscus syriacus]